MYSSAATVARKKPALCLGGLYDDHNVLTLYGNVPTFDPQIPLFFTDVSLLLVLAGWQLCVTCHMLRVFQLALSCREKCTLVFFTSVFLLF